ncbi:MAG: alpha/beta fold hydrolase [Nocardioides sp.]
MRKRRGAQIGLTTHSRVGVRWEFTTRPLMPWFASFVALAITSSLIAAAALPATGSPVSAARHAARSHGDELRPAPAVRAARPTVRRGEIMRALDPADPTSGRIAIGYEIHRARIGTPVGTILAIEGGPGYATTDSRDYYLDLAGPLLADHDLLLIDARGTGTSSPIKCRRLQRAIGGYANAVRRCGRRLGEASDVYGSAFAADDFAAVLDKLNINQVDVYGDSYGTFLGQTFAIRHPDRVRSLTLDAAYPVVDQNPLYPDLNRAMRRAFRSVCTRDEECRGRPLRRLRKAAERLRRNPLRGRAYDADGTLRKVRLNGAGLANLMGTATYGTTVYEELDTAVRVWLRRDDPVPLLRIAAEQGTYGGSGSPRYFSEGAYVAVICNDYPQLWDVTAPIPTRRRQFAVAAAQLRELRPRIFAPFSVDQWIASGWADLEACMTWRRPDTSVPPVPEPTDYPQVPTLVLVGDLDSITSAEGSRRVANAFPDATYVEVANVGHVTALADHSRCASDIVRRFVRDLDPGDTSCAQTAYPPVRTTDSFPARLAAVKALPGPGSLRHRRVAEAVTETVGDVFPRWFAMYGSRGRGLRGGTFTTTGLSKVRFRLNELRLVDEVAVSGRMRWNRSTGRVVARVQVSGQASGKLKVSWNEYDHQARARLKGRIGGAPVRLRLPAP